MFIFVWFHLHKHTAVNTCVFNLDIANKMWVFRKHLIKSGSYNRVKNLYTHRLDDGYLPTQSTMDELIKDKALVGPVQANFSIEVPVEVGEATTREESMEAYYNDMKPGDPVQCIGRRTRKNHKCAICMRRKKTKIRIRCGHVFHRKCLDEWARWRPVCPTCKDAQDLKPLPTPAIAQPDTEDNSGSSPSI